jgi:hypothetical protein
MGKLKDMINKVKLRKAGAGAGSEPLTGRAPGMPSSRQTARPTKSVSPSMGGATTPMGGGSPRRR